MDNVHAGDWLNSSIATHPAGRAFAVAGLARAKRRTLCTLLAATCLLTPSMALAADDLNALVEEALEKNPELGAIEAQIAALEHKTTQMGAWQNPKLMIAYQNVPVESFALGVEPMSMVMIRLEQTIPMPGKTSDREGVTRLAAQSKEMQLEEKRNELRTRVEIAYYRLALARQLAELTRSHIELVEQLIDAVRIKYEVGRARQENLLRLEVLRERLKDDLHDFARRDRELTATINATLHRSATVAIATPDSFALEKPAQSHAKLLEMARQNRQMLHALDTTTKMHRHAADLAKFEALPDPTFFASYGIRTELPMGNPGRDLVTLGVGFPLPIFYGSRNAAKASESLEMARATEASRDAALDRIAAGLEQSLATWDRAASKVSTYRETLVPKAHRTLDATFSSYQVDRADFLSLFEAELDLLNFEKAIRAATVEALVAQSTIAQLVGRQLP